MLYKFLDPSLCTHYNGEYHPYPVPTPDEKWGPWFRHPAPGEPDDKDCGAGGWHLMKMLDARYAPRNWWVWAAQGRDCLGESDKKARFVEVRLRRITLPVLARALRPPFNWGCDANLSVANLSRANLSDANLYRANLSVANLSDANLSDANLSDANLSVANLSRANLSDANLSVANLRRANLSNANLSDANLYGANLSRVRWNEYTVWPDGFELPEAKQ